MSYFQEGGTGYSVLKRLHYLDPFWTLHGGGALVYHLGHRDLKELDFFCEQSMWRESLAEFTANTIVPPSIPDFLSLRQNATETWRDPRRGVFKLHFEKVTLSFIRFARVSGTQERLRRPGLLPIAGLVDIAVLKLVVLRHRHKLVDYVDWVAILRRSGLSIGEIIEGFYALRDVYPERESLRECLINLADIPPGCEEFLQFEDIRLLREASVEGLRILEKQ